MKIAVSMSLHLPENRGKRDLYHGGFLKNVEAIPGIYPGADLVLHHDATVTPELAGMADVSVAHPPGTPSDCAFWRFLTVGSPDYDAVLVRDADSVVNGREAEAVAEWLDSGLGFHIMRDHPDHQARILGGMWGARRDALPYDFAHLVRWWMGNKGPFRYGDDEAFLSRYVYPYCERGGLIHCGGWSNLPNPRDFPGGPSPETGYVGERVH